MATAPSNPWSLVRLPPPPHPLRQPRTCWSPCAQMTSCMAACGKGYRPRDVPWYSPWRGTLVCMFTMCSTSNGSPVQAWPSRNTVECNRQTGLRVCNPVSWFGAQTTPRSLGEDMETRSGLDMTSNRCVSRACQRLPSHPGTQAPMQHVHPCTHATCAPMHPCNMYTHAACAPHGLPQLCTSSHSAVLLNVPACVVVLV